jgi:hypothetical protein
MSRFEEAWRAWLALNPAERAKFLCLFRQAYAEERLARLAARGHAPEGPTSAFNQEILAALDHEPRPRPMVWPET